MNIDINALLFMIKHEQGGITLFDVSTIIEALEQLQSENKKLERQLIWMVSSVDESLYVEKDREILYKIKESLPKPPEGDHENN